MKEIQVRDAQTDALIGRIWQEAGEIRTEGAGDGFRRQVEDLGWPVFQVVRRQWSNGYVYTQLRKRS